MIRLALCEDDPLLLETQRRLCQEVLQSLGWQAKLTLYTSGEELLCDWEKGIFHDILLLDIVMGDMDGMTLARKLRVLQAEASIVFITSNPNFALQGYDVDALHYLMKPLQANELVGVLQKHRAKSQEKTKVCFQLGTQLLFENLEDILYLETQGRGVAVVLKHKTLQVPGKLGDLLENIPNEGLLRCHQGFAVNPMEIQEIDTKGALLKGGHTVPIGRTYKKGFLDAFLNQLGQ